MPLQAARLRETDPSGPVSVLLSRIIEMEKADLALRRVMVATIMERAFYAMSGLILGDFTAHLHHLEDFLILFTAKPTMDRLAGQHLVNASGFSFLLRPWSKLAHAGQGRLD
jgi:hypothetical protein